MARVFVAALIGASGSVVMAALLVHEMSRLPRGNLRLIALASGGAAVAGLLFAPPFGRGARRTVAQGQ